MNLIDVVIACVTAGAIIVLVLGYWKKRHNSQILANENIKPLPPAAESDAGSLSSSVKEGTTVHSAAYASLLEIEIPVVSESEPDSVVLPAGQIDQNAHRYEPEAKQTVNTEAETAETVTVSLPVPAPTNVVLENSCLDEVCPGKSTAELGCNEHEAPSADVTKSVPMDSFTLNFAEHHSEDSVPTAEVPKAISENQTMSRSSTLESNRPEKVVANSDLETKPSNKSNNANNAALLLSAPGSVRIVAWLRGQMWRVGVELSPLPSSAAGLEVKQGGNVLEFDSESRRWLVNGPSEQISFDGLNFRDSLMPSPFPEPVLLFRLGRDIESICYSTPNLGQGDYLFVAPEQWVRIGGGAMAAESTTISGFKAHHFSMLADQQTEIKFRTSDNKIVSLKRPPVPEVFGTLLEAGFVDGVPTYGNEIVGLRLQNADDWRLYGKIRITDGSGKTRAIPISYENRDQHLPLSDSGLGIYRIDVIDKDGIQRWSEKIRHARGIKAFRMEMPLPIPEAEGAGHSSVPIRFRHEESWRIYSESGLPFLLSKPGQSDFLIPPSHECDLTHWTCEIDNSSIRIPLLIERIWWHVDANEMCSAPIMLTGMDFLATSEKHLTIKFPRCRWIGSLKAGFSEKAGRKFAVKVNESTLKIKLRDFTDCKEIQSFGVHDFFVWFEHAGVEYETVVAHVSIGANCKLCGKHSKSSFEMAEHLSQSHMQILSRNLTSQEMERMAALLPSSLFKCQACEHVLILANSCPDERLLSKHLNGGCIDSSVGRDAILLVAAQSELLDDLKASRACQQCSQIFEGRDDRMLAEHYLATHRTSVLAITRSLDS